MDLDIVYNYRYIWKLDQPANQVLHLGIELGRQEFCFILRFRVQFLTIMTTIPPKRHHRNCIPTSLLLGKTAI